MIIDKRNEILELSFEFALQIISYCESLEEMQIIAYYESPGEKHIVHYLLKSGTSIGANIHKAHDAECKQDFIHKLKAAAKEAEETEYWLRLCEKSVNYPSSKALMTSLANIRELLNSIISTL